METFNTAASYTNCLSRNIHEQLGSEFIEKNSRSYFTAPYSHDMHEIFEKFFDQDDVEMSFLPKDRIALTYEILSRVSFGEMSDDPFECYETFEVDSRKGIQRLLADKTFLDAFPLHDTIDPNDRKFTNDREVNWRNIIIRAPFFFLVFKITSKVIE